MVEPTNRSWIGRWPLAAIAIRLDAERRRLGADDVRGLGVRVDAVRRDLMLVLGQELGGLLGPLGRDRLRLGDRQHVHRAVAHEAEQRQHVQRPRRAHAAVVGDQDRAVLVGRRLRADDQRPGIALQQLLDHVGDRRLVVEMKIGVLADHQQIVPHRFLLDHAVRHAFGLDHLPARAARLAVVLEDRARAAR